MTDFETNLRNMFSLQNWVEVSGQGVHNPSEVLLESFPGTVEPNVLWQ